MTLDEIVSDYIREYRDEARKEMRFFEIQRSPSEAIRKALCELPSGKRHPHQRRIPRALLEQIEAKLQGIGRNIASATSFAQLHRAVEDEIGIKSIVRADCLRHRSLDRRSFQEISGACVPPCGYDDRCSSVRH